MTPHQLIRQRLEEAAGLHTKDRRSLPEIYNADEVIHLVEFCMQMIDRIIMGRFRYGEPNHYRFLPKLRQKLALYEDTGNTEFLRDVSNYSFLESRYGDHPNKHYKATDR